MTAAIKFGTDGWRAIIGDEFTFENVRKVTQAYSDYLGKSGTIIVGYDRRFLSADFATTTAEVLAANGHKIYISIRFIPTPCLSWTVRKMGAAGGVMITASHNPYQWNGFKIKESNGGAALPTTTSAIEKHLGGKGVVTSFHSGDITRVDPTHNYLAALKKLIDLSSIRRAKLKILYDPMYGAGVGYFKKLLGRQVTEIHTEPDPTFGGIQPEPIEANLAELKKRMRHGRFDVGLATDGDADRIAAFDEKGNYVDAHHIFALVLQYLVEIEKRRGDVVKTVTATHMVDRLARLYNLPIHETPVGFKHICRKFLELSPRPTTTLNNNVIPAKATPRHGVVPAKAGTSLHPRDPRVRGDDKCSSNITRGATPGPLIGGEESGGIGVCHHLYERDGIFVGLLLLEIVARARKPLSQIVRDLRLKIGPLVYRRVDIEIPRDRIERLMARLAKNGLDRIGGLKVQRIDQKDGYKFYLEGDAWLLVRPSGTEPLLRTYAEAPHLLRVRRLLKEARALAG